MAIQVLQRYVLVANGAVTSVPLSGTAGIIASTALVPLSGQWTIRLATIGGAMFSQDNSGSLSVESLGLQWLFTNSAGSVLFTYIANRSYITPAVAFPKLSGQSFTDWNHTDQIISSLDQVGGVIAFVQGAATAVVLNTDAANPHSVQAQVQAIIEFAAMGSS